MTEFKPVVVVHPDGREYTATTAAEFNNLVYGAGYTVKAERKTSAKKEEAKS